MFVLLVVFLREIDLNLHVIMLLLLNSNMVDIVCIVPRAIE